MVGALCFSRGEQRFSAAEKSWTLIMRFSAGLGNQGLKSLRENSRIREARPLQQPKAAQRSPSLDDWKIRISVHESIDSY